MGNCKDCTKWYRRDQTCRVDWVERSDRVEEGEMAIFAEAHDDSGLMAGLKTGPLFGCVQFQPKPKRKE